MFSGIVETTGRIKRIHALDGAIKLLVESGISFDDLSIGDSISVNGVCLTVVELDGQPLPTSMQGPTKDITGVPRRCAPHNDEPGAAALQEPTMPVVAGAGSIQSVIARSAATWHSGGSSNVGINDSRSFAVEVVPHTLRITNLGELVEGSSVNLERSLRYNARIGGHLVQGHIDGTGRITNLRHDGSKALLVRVALPQNLCRYAVSKGYIALDGMSITIIEADHEHIVVTLIPHTQECTVAKDYKLGTSINIEVDILGKFIEKLHANICAARQ